MMTVTNNREEFQRIGLNILICRRERKMSQSELAQITGLSRAMISNMERGKANFRLDNLLAIAEGLEIDFRELFKTKEIN